MEAQLDEATVALLSQQIWAGFLYRERQANAARARAASLTPERRQEIARSGTIAAAAKRAAQRQTVSA
jgi:hypothetical protein